MPQFLDDGPVIYCDIEKDLKVPPDVICDNRKLPIRDGIANVIIFDPPCWRFGHSEWYGDPKEQKKTMFYGNYVNKNKLLRLLVGGMKTIRRVLGKDGVFYFKWRDGMVEIERILPIFIKDFEEVYREETPSKWGKTDNTNYWIGFKMRNQK